MSDGGQEELGSAVLRLSTEDEQLYASVAQAKKITEDLSKKFDETHDNLKEKFSEKFEHVGIHIFGHDLLASVGIAEGARPILSALQFGVRSLAGAFGLATGPIGLVVFGLVALAAIAMKVREAHEKQAEALKDLVEKQDSALKKTVELKDKLEDYEKVIGRLPPELETLKGAVNDLAKVQGGQLVQSEAKLIASAEEKIRSAERQREHLITLRNEEIGYQASMEKGSLVFNRSVSAANSLTFKIREQEDVIRANKDQVKLLTAEMAAHARGQAGSAEAIAKQTAAAKEALEANKSLAKLFADQQDEAQKASDAFLDYTDKMEGRIQSMNAAADVSELGQIRKHFDDVRAEADREYEHRARLLEAEHLDQDTFSQRAGQMWTQRERLMTSISQAEAAKRQQYYKNFFGVVDNGDLQLLTGTKAAVDAISSSWSSHLTQLVVYGEQWKQNFLDIMKDIVASFMQSILEMEIRYLAFQALTGLGGLGGGGGALPMPGYGGARAFGGSVQPGSFYEVGEHGRELFFPNQPGTIVPNDKISGAGGGDVHIHQTFSVAGIDLGSAEAVRKFLRQAASQMRRGAVEAQQFARATSDQIQLQPRRAY
jgi:hypothetical protein